MKAEIRCAPVGKSWVCHVILTASSIDERQLLKDPLFVETVMKAIGGVRAEAYMKKMTEQLRISLGRVEVDDVDEMCHVVLLAVKKVLDDWRNEKVKEIHAEV